MQYTCAHFPNGTEDIEAAQIAKFKLPNIWGTYAPKIIWTLAAGGEGWQIILKRI
jgi:hypothetical protein